MAGHARGSWNTEELNRKANLAKGMHRIPFRLERIPAISDHDAMIPSFQLSNSFVESECGTAFKPLPHRKPQATSSLRGRRSVRKRPARNKSPRTATGRDGANAPRARRRTGQPATVLPNTNATWLRHITERVLTCVQVKRQNLRATRAVTSWAVGLREWRLGFGRRSSRHMDQDLVLSVPSTR